MSLEIKIGTYTFTDYIDTFEINQNSRVEQVAIPRRDGFLSDVAYKSGLTIRMGGIITCQDYNNARTALNSIKNAIGNGKVVITLFSDRQITGQQTYFMSAQEETDMRRIRWECELSCDDIGFVDVNPTTTTKTISTSPQTDTFVQNGNLETCPVIRISAVGGDITTGLRIDNLTTGKYFIIGAQIDSGKYIEIDTDLLTVVDQDGTNQIANFNGDFLKLAAGTNSIKWTGSTGAHTLAMTFRGKYDGA